MFLPSIKKYRFPSLFAVDRDRHFEPRILNSQIKRPFLTGKLLYSTLLSMWISKSADKKSANNEGRLDSQTWANDNLRISKMDHIITTPNTTTCLQRPLFWRPIFPDLEYIVTSEQRPPFNIGQNYGVQKVVVVLRFDCMPRNEKKTTDFYSNFRTPSSTPTLL